LEKQKPANPLAIKGPPEIKQKPGEREWEDRKQGREKNQSKKNTIPTATPKKRGSNQKIFRRLAGHKKAEEEKLKPIFKGRSSSACGEKANLKRVLEEG